MKPQKSLRTRAMDILSRQEISRVGLKRKLVPYAESEEELENVLDEFAERNWQSDQRTPKPTSTAKAANTVLCV